MKHEDAQVPPADAGRLETPVRHQWSGLPPTEPRIHYEGPVAFHTQRCAVLPGEYAVLDLNAGVFRPSWAAQQQGWRLVRADTWLRRLALRLFGDA